MLASEEDIFKNTKTQVNRTLQMPITNCIIEKIYSEEGYDNHILSIEKLTQISIELIKSNNKLRKDVKELKRWVQIKKRKIIVIDWLNENMKPNQDYNNFITDIIINRNHLEYIFKTNYVDGIQEIIQNYISNYEEKNIPFKSFDQKDDTIYVYHNKENIDATKDTSVNDKGKWELLSPTVFNSMISIISKGILTEFKKWQDENEHQLYTEDFSVIYIQNVKKVMGGDVPLEKLRNKIHKNLYKHLKLNLQNTIQYEFQ